MKNTLKIVKKIENSEKKTKQNKKKTAPRTRNEYFSKERQGAY